MRAEESVVAWGLDATAAVAGGEVRCFGAVRRVVRDRFGTAAPCQHKESHVPSVSHRRTEISGHSAGRTAGYARLDSGQIAQPASFRSRDDIETSGPPKQSSQILACGTLLTALGDR